MLPMHPQPESDELLSSWMVRLAFANGYGLHTFYNKVLGYKAPLWNRDTDRCPSADLITLLSRRSGQPEAVLHSLSLLFYEGILFSRITPVGNTPWLLPVGVFHRVRRHAGMQFCPACLRGDAIPYYRRYWRLAFYVVCHRHQCLLSDCCPVCGQPVAFHRHGIGQQRIGLASSMACCSACGTDLRLTPFEDLGYVSAGLKGFEPFGLASLQHSMALPCAVPFFQGLHCLVSILMGRHGSLLRKEITDHTGLAIDGAKHEFELLGRIERARLMTAVYWLLERWPTRFIEICSAAGFTRSRLCDCPSALPFWLASVAEEFLDGRALVPCDQEILAARDVLLRRQANITARSLADLMGISLTCARHARRLCRSAP